MMPNRPFEDNRHSFLSIRDMGPDATSTLFFSPNDDACLHLKQIKSYGE